MKVGQSKREGTRLEKEGVEKEYGRQYKREGGTRNVRGSQREDTFLGG